MIKVLIADDQELIRQSLQIVLNSRPDIMVTDVASNGQEVIRSVRKNKPDVILMDIRMPKLDGVQCTKIIKENYPQIKIIILTTFDDDEYVYNALKYGASGYLLKGVSMDELANAITTVYNGWAMINPVSYTHLDVYKRQDLTIAQQQMVEIVKAISYRSRILVMDEPTSSISDKEVEFLFSTMRELTKKGVGIIYISHKMDELEQICDRVTVLRDGTYVGTERVKDTTRDHLIAMMVGRELTKYYTRDYMEPGRVVLKCENIADGKMVKGASFELREGEIIGFAGLVGAGRSETMKCIFGLKMCIRDRCNMHMTNVI